jgi:hypothetical protein
MLNITRVVSLTRSATMFHPSIEQLHASILNYFHDTVSRFPPPHAPGTLPPSLPPYRLGEYLIDLGYLLPRELATVLPMCHQRSQPHIPIGCILSTRELIPTQVLATVLLLQGLDRLEQLPSLAPRFLGEQLLIDGYLRPEQLALVLEEQIVGYQHGRWNRLGALIVHHGWLDQVTLAQEARQQVDCS